jgi:hypothetical protein
MTADASLGGVTFPLDSPADISATPPLKRRNFALDPIDTTAPNIPRPSSRTAEPVSPAPTEIALDLGDIEQTPEERLESLQAAGIKVRDFAYEPMPNSSKAPEVFDPLPSLIAADWHMRNPDKNFGLLSPKNLFRLLKVGWLSLEDVRMKFHPREYTALAEYNDRPEERRYPFVVSRKDNIPTPSERVRLRRRAGLRTYPNDIPDRDFFGYDPTGESDDAGLPSAPPRALSRAAPVAAEALARSTSVVEETAATETAGAAAEQPKAKRRRAKGATKARSRAKPLRRECSRPEV